MFRKSIFLSFLVVLLFQSNITFARDQNWWSKQDNWSGAAGNGRWEDPCNWSTSNPNSPRPPDINVWACIEPKGPGPNVTTTDAGCFRLSVQPWSWSGATNIECNIAPTAGSFDCGVSIGIGDVAGYNSATSGHGIINMYGGTMFTPMALPGDLNGLWIGGSWNKVGYCSGVLNMFGGLITVPRIALYNGAVNLYGGVLENTQEASSDFIISDTHTGITNKINFSGGTLRLQGDRRTEIENFIAAGKIIAYNSRGSSYVTYDYNVTTPGFTTATGVSDLGAAWNPKPTIGQKEVEYVVPPVLVWNPGDYVNTVKNQPGDSNGHRVYLGTSFGDVNTATPSVQKGVYKGAFDTNTFDVNKKVGSLAFNTWYYWRIDEVNVGTAGSPWKGAVWNFRTISGIALYPYPPNDSNIGFDVNNKLYMRWTKGLLAADTSGHRVFFGTSFNEVNDADTSTPTLYRGIRTDANYALSSLSPNYTLVPDTNYYWRVDEVNAGNPISPWKGDVWRMVFPNNYIVENFSQYVSTDDLSTVWKKGHLSGSCPSGGYVGGGATPTFDQPTQTMILDYNNTGQLKDRYSEMRFDYPAVGADWTVSSVPSGTPKLLHISYLGAANNNADPCLDRMYVMIRDTVGTAGHQGPTIYNPNPTAQQKSTWQDWYILLSDLSSPSVDLTKIRYLFIGLGLRCNKQGTAGIPGGGAGQVTYDNIWVTQTICNPQYGPTADFSDDCFVDIADVDLFVNDWLLSDTTLNYPDACAPPTAPVLWFDFNETDGNIAHNSGSGGSAYDANIVNRNILSTWDANGYIGRCINLVYGYQTNVNVPPAVLAPFANGSKTGITFTFWVNMDANNPPGSEWPTVVSVYVGGSEAIQVQCPTPKPPVFDYGPRVDFQFPPQSLNSPAARTSDFGGSRWNHYAVVKDADANVMSIYENGRQIATLSADIASPLFSSAPDTFRIGARGNSSSGSAGRLDDFRMYDYALDANQIAWVATNGTKSLFVPLVESTNLKMGSPPEIVNFGDFALFANQWLTEKLWP